MFNISDSIKIRKPVSEVYHFASEPANFPRWQRAVEHVDAPDGPATRGETYREVMQINNREVEATYEVVDVAPNQHLSLRTTQAPIELHVDMSFVPDGDDETRLTTTVQAETNGYMDLKEEKFRRQLQKQLKHDDRELKTLLEKSM